MTTPLSRSRPWRRLFVWMMSGLVVLTAARDSGAAGPDPDIGGYRYQDYAPYGREARGTFKFGQWATVPADAQTTMVHWGDPKRWNEANVEEHAIVVHPVDGRRWVWIRAYKDQKVNRRYAIQTSRAELIRNGHWKAQAVRVRRKCVQNVL